AVERLHAHFQSSYDVGKPEAARVVQMKSRKGFAADGIAHAHDEVADLRRIRVADRIGKTDLVATGLAQLLRETHHFVSGHGSFIRAAECRRHAAFELG